MSAVYFIRPEGEPFVKIGLSRSSLLARMNVLQVGHPKPLNFMAAIPGGRKEELALHERFAAFRHRGEWFRLEGVLADYIGTLPDWSLWRKALAILEGAKREWSAEAAREGLRTRVEAGHQLGAKPKMTKEQVAKAKRDLAKQDATVKEVAEKYGVTPSTLTKWTGGKAKALRAAKRKGK